MSEALASHRLDLVMSCTAPGLCVVPVSHIGLVDLGIDDEKDKKKFLEIINEEEKCVKEFIQRSNKTNSRK